MKIYRSVVLVACSILVLGCVHAQSKPDDHSAHHPSEKRGATTATPGDAEAPADMESMRSNMKQMQELMSKIQNAKDPAERQALLQEHEQAMRKQMDMMHSMGGSMMMGMSGKSGTAMGNKESMMHDGKGMPCGDMMKCHQMMEGRMDMMQTMMEQMMQHQAAEHESHSGAK